MIEQLESELRSAFRARADELPSGAGARARARNYRPRTRDRRPPVAAGVLATAAAAAAAVLFIDLGPRTPTAFAGWTRVPTHASAAQLDSAKASCQARLASAPAPPANAPKAASLSDFKDLTPVLTDSRGPFTFVILAGPDASASCISGPQFTSLSGTRASTDLPTAPAGKVLVSSEYHTARAGNAYSFVEGHAGDGVTAATLVLDDGSHVSATIQNGWLVAWWPGSAQLVSAEVTTASGTTTQHFDTRSAPNCPNAPAGSPAGADTACSGGPGGGRGTMSGASAVQSTGTGPGSGHGAASGSTASGRAGG